MIVTENLTINDKSFVKTYSDSGKYVVRDGVSYSEAIDPAELGRTYTEGEPMEDTETPEESVVQEKAKAYDILVGAEQ